MRSRSWIPDEWRAEIQSSGSSLGRSLGVDGESEDLHEEAACEANLGIVYLGALDEEVARRALTLIESISSSSNMRRGPKRERFWLVTKGAMNVRGLEDVTSPGQASLWGLAGPLPGEHSSNWGGLLDIDPTGDTADAVAAIVDTIRADDDEDQIVWRDGSRRAARLVPDSEPTASRSFCARPDRAYLITGGFGGIGASTRVLVGGQWRATSRACWT